MPSAEAVFWNAERSSSKINHCRVLKRKKQ